MDSSIIQAHLKQRRSSMESFTVSEATPEQCIEFIAVQFAGMEGTGLAHEERMTVLRRLASLCKPATKEPETEG